MRKIGKQLSCSVLKDEKSYLLDQDSSSAPAFSLPFELVLLEYLVNTILIHTPKANLLFLFFFFFITLWIPKC